MAETIFALSTAAGRAAVAVLRVSGPAAFPALAALTGAPQPAPREMTLRRLRDPTSGWVLDQSLVVCFPGPASVTGEDLLELHLHGGPSVIAAVLGALGQCPGLRPAVAGEFTRRAFDKGKLDLTEVEGLADLIDAETEAQRRQALRQMEGGLGRLVEGWRESLLQASALAEAQIDFADEDLPDDIQRQFDHSILGIESEITQYIDDAGIGERLREGCRAVIVGPPNAGKSSLLNALVRREAAIVTEQAGTTRDVIEVHLDIAGYPVTLADTAGLRQLAGGAEAPPGDAIEAEGIRRARQALAAADLVMAVFDQQDWPGLEPSVLELLDSRATLIINKIDQCGRGDPLPSTLEGLPCLGVSAQEGTGLSELTASLERQLVERFASAVESPLITRSRHREALQDVVAALTRLRDAALPELAAEDLRLARRALGRITGGNDVEEVLDRIFSSFCIGK